MPLQPGCAINKKQAVGNVVFLGQFLQELLCQDDRSCRKQPHMEKFVGVRIHSSVQPKPLIIELNHSLVNRNVIRVLPADRL